MTKQSKNISDIIINFPEKVWNGCTNFLMEKGTGLLILPLLFILFFYDHHLDQSIRDIEKICGFYAIIESDELFPKYSAIDYFNCLKENNDEETCQQKLSITAELKEFARNNAPIYDTCNEYIGI